VINDYDVIRTNVDIKEVPHGVSTDVTTDNIHAFRSDFQNCFRIRNNVKHMAILGITLRYKLIDRQRLHDRQSSTIFQCRRYYNSINTQYTSRRKKSCRSPYRKLRFVPREGIGTCGHIQPAIISYNVDKDQSSISNDNSAHFVLFIIRGYLTTLTIIN